jgi:signal transduction histidine kinase
MRLVRRLTLYLLLAVGTVFVIDTAIGIRSHLALFDEDAREDERLLSLALARAFERTWQQQGPESAHELLRSMDDGLLDVGIRFVYLDEERGAPFGPEAPKPALRAAIRDKAVTHVREEGEPEARLYTYAPLNVPSDRPMALEVIEPLSHESEYLQDRILRKLVTAAALVTVCGLVAWLVGLRVVGRPVQALVAQARRIGRGDFSTPLVLPQRDELAQLASEMNAMASALEVAARRVEEETSARLRALEQLRHADRLTTVGKLASGLAHELGTPLNVIAGRARMIANGEIDGPEEGAESARIIADQADRMTRIVRQLLDFARRRPTEKCSADVGEIARQTAAMLEPLAAKRNVALDCAAPAAPVRAVVDAPQIQQALTNLVVNAIQACEREREVAISVSRREDAPDGRHGARLAGPFALIEVRDQGAGIPAEHLDEVFDPFFTTKPVGEGTGLGLSVAHGIALEHGGWIDVDSEPGRGSCFRIWLPQGAA